MITWAVSEWGSWYPEELFVFFEHAIRLKLNRSGSMIEYLPDLIVKTFTESSPSNSWGPGFKKRVHFESLASQ
jgi:hypothetical protein